MTTELLRENVVSDDVIHLADIGKIFKGGYVAIIEYHTFATSWTDKKHYKRFRTMDNAEKFINKYYKGDTEYGL